MRTAGKRNALTIDLEDWRQLMHRRLTGQDIPPSRLVLEEVDELLLALERRHVTATFFVLGVVGRAFPDLLTSIDRAGHEIACHGWSHEPVHRQSPELFHEETRRSKATLEAIIGKPVRGYRAANFSIGRNSQWAYDVLAELGFTYDSGMMFPERSDVSSRSATAGDGTHVLRKLPVTRCRWLGRSWPIGGGYLHILPYRNVADALRATNADEPALVYLHPYDWPACSLHLSHLGGCIRRGVLRLRYPHAIGRKRVRATVDQLLGDFPFGPILGNLVSPDPA